MDGKAPGSYRDVVNDYVKCHKLHSNLDAFFNAVTIGHEYSKFLFYVCRCITVLYMLHVYMCMYEGMLLLLFQIGEEVHVGQCQNKACTPSAPVSGFMYFELCIRLVLCPGLIQ